MSASVEHGRYSSYRLCNARPEGSCQACRDANAAYKREYNARPGKRQRNVQRNCARDRALRELARRHPTEFQVLHFAELAKLDGAAS